MYVDDLLVLSHSQDGLQQSVHFTHKHAQDWKLKNKKKSNIIILSGNGQNNKIYFKHQNETLQIVDKQTCLGIEMTSSGRYTYPRQILCKEVIKVLSTIKRLLSYIDSPTVEIKSKLFDALVNPVLLYGCEVWIPDLLSYSRG